MQIIKIDKYMTDYSATEFEKGVRDELGVVYSEDGQKLLEATKDLESYRVKEGTKIICDQAFYRCYMLKDFYMPDSVIAIGKEAFIDCYRLSEIRLSENLTDIGVSAFRDCKNIRTIHLPDSLERFGVSTFNGCSLLQRIEIPTHVLVIPAYAFEGCQSLRECFCKRKLKRIEERAFHWCVNLESIEFEQEKDVKMDYPSELKLHKVSITSGIEHYAFEGCTSLYHLVLPNSISFIGKCAFRYCYSLHDISFGSKLEAVNETAFSKCPNLVHLYIPNNAKMTYEALGEFRRLYIIHYKETLVSR